MTPIKQKTITLVKPGRNFFPKQVNLAEHGGNVPRLSDDPITFTEEEAHRVWHPHNNTIVINLRISRKKVYQILIDNRSFLDILFKSTP